MPPKLPMPCWWLTNYGYLKTSQWRLKRLSTPGQATMLHARAQRWIAPSNLRTCTVWSDLAGPGAAETIASGPGINSALQLGARLEKAVGAEQAVGLPHTEHAHVFAATHERHIGRLGSQKTIDLVSRRGVQVNGIYPRSHKMSTTA